LTSQLILAFVVIFSGSLVAALGALKYYDKRRKEQVRAVLKTISGEPLRPQTKILKDLPGEDLRPLERILHHFNLADRAEAAIRQAGLDWTLEKLLMAMGVGAVAAAFLGAVFLKTLSTFAAVLLMGSIGMALPYLFVLRKRSKRLAAFEEQLPDALDFLARSMRAGHAFTISLEMMSDEMPDPVGDGVPEAVQ